jgi:pyridoxamine 5'-phosphate oxidase family protein
MRGPEEEPDWPIMRDGRQVATASEEGEKLMSSFTPREIAYLQSQLLGRLATVGANGDPHVVPVGFRYNPELDTVDIGGHGIAQSKKYRDVARTGRAAFVVDDLVSTDPWTPRMLAVRGRADALPSGGQAIMPAFAPELIRIFPTWIGSFGINASGFTLNSRDVG